MKTLLIVMALLLLALPILAQDDMDPCVLDPPMEAAEINFMGWAFPITEFFAAELEKCNEVENLTVNIQLLDSPNRRGTSQPGAGWRRRLALGDPAHRTFAHRCFVWI